MSPIMLRQFWSLIEATQRTIPFSLDDNSLVQWLLHYIRTERPFAHSEADLIEAYIHSRLSLIRDLAQEH